MNKWKSSAIAFIVPVLLVVSCATPAHVERDDAADFSRYKTFSWVSSTDKNTIREVQVADKATTRKSAGRKGNARNSEDQAGAKKVLGNDAANAGNSNNAGSTTTQADNNAQGAAADNNKASGDQPAAKQRPKTSAERDREEREAARKQEQAKVNDLTEKQIRAAVTAELEKQGWKEDKNKPDVLISYDMLLENSTRQSANSMYNSPYSRMYYNPWMMRYGSIYYPSGMWGYNNGPVAVRERTLTITMMDARTDQTVWQGWTTSDANGRNVTKKEVESGVKSIFRKFDVAGR